MTYANRAVAVAPEHEEEVLDSIRRLSARCRENILMIDEELRSQDPDLAERCGLLADRYEVYAVRVPGCAGHLLAVSVDRRSRRPPPAMIHGAVAAGAACRSARRLATRHRKLIDPSWE